MLHFLPVWNAETRYNIIYHIKLNLIEINLLYLTWTQQKKIRLEYKWERLCVLTRLLFEHDSKLRSWNGQLVIYRYYKISLLSCYHHCLTCTQAKLTSLTKPQCWFLEVKTTNLFFTVGVVLSTHRQICIQSPEIKVILFTCLNKHLLQRKTWISSMLDIAKFSFYLQETKLLHHQSCVCYAKLCMETDSWSWMSLHEYKLKLFT